MQKNLDISRKSIHSSFPLENVELEEFVPIRIEDRKIVKEIDPKLEVENEEHEMDLSDEENNERESSAVPGFGSENFINIADSNLEKVPNSEDFIGKNKCDDLDTKSENFDYNEKNIDITDSDSNIREHTNNCNEINTPPPEGNENMDNGNNPVRANNNDVDMDNGNNPGRANNNDVNMDNGNNPGRANNNDVNMDNGNNPGRANNNDDRGRRKKVLKEIGKFALKTAAISGVVLGGTALIVPAIGFGSLGVAGGSLAALYQSSVLGGTIASGSAFATLQSIGMAGLSAAANAGVVAGSAAVSGVQLIKNIKKKD